MALYKETYVAAANLIKKNWEQNRSKPFLFAKVKIKFGEKYMVDYSERYIRQGITVLADYKSNIDEIINMNEDFILERPMQHEITKTSEPVTEDNFLTPYIIWRHFARNQV